MPATSSRSSVLWTTWNCTPWRVVRRSLLVGEFGHPVEGQPLLGADTPPGTEARTMHE